MGVRWMTDITRLWLYQYFQRIVAELENELRFYQSKTLQSCDGLDIIEYIELLQRFRQAVQIQQDVYNILSWGDGADQRRNYTK